MPGVLLSTVAFNGLVVGVPTSLPHGLRHDGMGIIPDLVLPDEPGFTITADATNVTVTRPDAGLPANMQVLAVRYHSIVRALTPGLANLIPQPFIPNFGTGLGGGGTLDAAYDFGGPHLGREIFVDADFPVDMSRDGQGQVSDHTSWGLELSNDDVGGAIEYSPAIGWTGQQAGVAATIRAAVQLQPSNALIDLSNVPWGWTLLADDGGGTFARALAVTPTTPAFFYFVNDTPAADGAQQESPTLVQLGNGWDDNLGQSVGVAMRDVVTPIQNAGAAPTARKRTSRVINNAVTDILDHYSTGLIDWLAADANRGDLGLNARAGDPAAPVEGDLWYNTTLQAARLRTATGNVSLGGDDPVVFEATQPADAATMAIAPLDGDTDGIYEIYGALVLDSNAFQLHWRPNGVAVNMVGFYLNNGAVLTPPDWRFFDISAGTAPPFVVRMKAVLWAKRNFGGVLGNQHRFIETWAGGEFPGVAATDDRRQSGYYQDNTNNLTSLVIETTGGNILQGSWVGVRRMSNLVF